MQIKIKLMGALRTKLRARFQVNTATLDLETGATVATALEKLGLSTGQVHLVMVNGEMDHDKTRTLKEGDELTLFPPVAGGRGVTGSWRGVRQGMRLAEGQKTANVGHYSRSATPLRPPIDMA